MAQIISASKKTYNSIKRCYKLASLNGKNGFSLWGNYMTLDKAEMVMDMLEMSLGLPNGYDTAPERKKNKARHKARTLKQFPAYKMIPFDYINGNEKSAIIKKEEYLQTNEKIKSLLCLQ
jgi:hypothetical protein